MAPCLFEQKETKLRGNFLLHNFFGRVYSPHDWKLVGGGRLICPVIVEGGELGAYWSRGGVLRTGEAILSNSFYFIK